MVQCSRHSPSIIEERLYTRLFRHVHMLQYSFFGRITLHLWRMFKYIFLHLTFETSTWKRRTRLEDHTTRGPHDRRTPRPEDPTTNKRTTQTWKSLTLIGCSLNTFHEGHKSSMLQPSNIEQDLQINRCKHYHRRLNTLLKCVSYVQQIPAGCNDHIILYEHSDQR